eukprot:Anaeramoba_flamelloidesa1068514_7.p1 GENE.a1068514_7~~a1068514_7.p1  ORF type:complete len:109 (-),score=8.90 a1068514_7:127-453(-)
MCNCKKKREIKVDESYVTFNDIDCFENACVVVDNLLRICKDPQYNNAYWDKFICNIPEAYYSRNEKDDPTEALLYLVCSNAFYIIELFEDADDEDAIHALEKCEQECC